MVLRLVFVTVLLAVSWAAPAPAPQFSPPSGPGGPPFGPFQGPGGSGAPLPPGPAPPPLPPGPRGPFVPIVQQSFDQEPDGSYRWSYQTADGSAQEATGTVTNPGSPAQSIAVQGSYTYQSPEGPIQVGYIADDFGYQPTGNAVHPSIQKAVAHQVALARSEPPGVYNEAGFPTGPFPGSPFSGPNPGPGQLPGNPPPGSLRP